MTKIKGSQVQVSALQLALAFFTLLWGVPVARGEDIMLKEISVNAPASIIVELKAAENVIKASPALFGMGGVYSGTQADAGVAIANAYKFLSQPAGIKLLAVGGDLHPYQLAPGVEYSAMVDAKVGDYEWTFARGQLRAIDFGHKVFGERLHKIEPSGRIFWELHFYGSKKEASGRWLTIFCLQDGSVILPTVRNATRDEIPELEKLRDYIWGKELHGN